MSALRSSAAYAAVGEGAVSGAATIATATASAASSTALRPPRRPSVSIAHETLLVLLHVLISFVSAPLLPLALLRLHIAECQFRDAR